MLIFGRMVKRSRVLLVHAVVVPRARCQFWVLQGHFLVRAHVSVFETAHSCRLIILIVRIRGRYAFGLLRLCSLAK